MQAIPGARRGAGGRHDDFSSDVESGSRKKTCGTKVNSGVFVVFTCLLKACNEEIIWFTPESIVALYDSSQTNSLDDNFSMHRPRMGRAGRF